MDPITILSALLPVATHAVSRVIDHFTGGPQPQSVDEAIKLQHAEVEKLQALAQLDSPTGNTSKWVSDVRAMQRPAAVLLILLAWAYCMLDPSINKGVAEIASNLASSVVFYLFGDRTMMYFTSSKTK